MRIAIAYISVILLWATTPLAIKWSIESAGFLFGVTARMAIGTLCVLLVLLLSKQRLVWHGKAQLTYAAVALQIYGSMLVIYWAAQFIPSGWISVIAGLTPLITALLAAIWLREQSLTLGKLLSYLMGIAGLVILFGSAFDMNYDAVLGMAGVLLGVFLQSFSAVWVKRIDAKLPALVQVAGGLLLALLAYVLTWQVFGGQLPTDISFISLASILYLGVVATTLGFVLYYYLLTQLETTQVALITLICPVMSLLLGYSVNHELLTQKVILGTAFILIALFIHLFFDWFLKLRRQ
ncbi:MAG: DMT family transporter [Methylococcales bacterium]|nr:DMT family transporter [Methylococcales bacterium]